MLFSHFRRDSKSCLFPSGFPIKTSHVFSLPRMSYKSRSSSLNWSPKQKAKYYEIFSILLLRSSFVAHTPSLAPILEHPKAMFLS
jgi:hypothetical protein